MSAVARFVRSAIIWVGAVIGFCTIVVVVCCVITGVRPAIVISGSMEPTIPTGSMTFARSIDAADVEVGDIVTVNRNVGTGLVTHRVVAVDRSEGVTRLTLRGDANAVDDPLPYDVATVGEVVFHVPGMGIAASLIKTPLGITIIVILVVVYLLFGIRRVPASAPGGRALGGGSD